MTQNRVINNQKPTKITLTHSLTHLKHNKINLKLFPKSLKIQIFKIYVFTSNIYRHFTQKLTKHPKILKTHISNKTHKFDQILVKLT